MEKKHSVLGIASFAISIAVGILMLMLIVGAAVLNAHRAPGSAVYPGQTLVGLAAILLLVADLVAAALGIASVFQEGRERLFGILGSIFSLGTIFGSVALIIVGLLYAGRAGQ